MKINESKSRIELFFMVVWFLTKGLRRCWGVESVLNFQNTQRHRFFLRKFINSNFHRKFSDEINLFSFRLFQISLLIEEIARLRTAIQALQESHNVQIQRLEESLDAKRHHISRLENRIGKSDYDDMKKENR